MVECGLYYATVDFATMIRSVGGAWDDPKRRPIICLIKSKENDNLYWAIPMGKLNHRTADQKKRIYSYINRAPRDIRSCYYHIGRTTTKSIFFISEAVPITDKYIDVPHLGPNKIPFVVKNETLISELERKLKRILRVENSKNNSFRQHITDIKKALLDELNKQQSIL